MWGRSSSAAVVGLVWMLGGCASSGAGASSEEGGEPASVESPEARRSRAAWVSAELARLAAWLVEKYRSWSDCDGDVEKRFTKEELLTFIMIPWVTQTAGSSFRIYRESTLSKDSGEDGYRRFPRGVAMFPKELVKARRAFGERFFDLRRWTDMPRGGHFGAFEEPELLAEDIRAFFYEDLKLA